MKKFNVFELSVVKVNRGNDTYQYFICKYDGIKNVYVEVFTKLKIKVHDDFLVKPLSAYYSLFSWFNFKTSRPLMLDKKALLSKYNDINYINFCLETDAEKIRCELDKRGIFENSKIYKR